MKQNTIATSLCAIALLLALTHPLAWAQALATATAPLDATKAREAECSLGDLLADALRSALNADLALLQASQLRPETIPAGELTRQVLTGVLLYPDEQVVLVEIPGDKLLAALERSLSMLPKPSTAFLQVSGLTVTFRSQNEPGQRVSEVKVGAQPLSPATTYRVAMPSSLAKGALGYFRIFNTLEPKQTGPPLGEALCSYVQARRVISPPPDPRLRDLTPPQPQ